MRRLSMLVGFILVGAAGAGAAVVVATSAESAPPPPKGVVKVAEQNVGENGAIRVEQQGVAAITIQGTPTFRLDTKQDGPIAVQPAPREQFQQLVEVSSQEGSPDCAALKVPGGRRLTIEHFSADVLTTSSEPVAYLTSVAVAPDGTRRFGSSVQVELTHVTEALWSGNEKALLFTGPTAPDGDSFEYRVCAVNATFTRATVTGYLD